LPGVRALSLRNYSVSETCCARPRKRFALVECFEERDTDCRIARCCALKGALARALEAFVAELDGYTLADLIAPARPLERIQAVEVRSAGRAASFRSLRTPLRRSGRPGRCSKSAARARQANASVALGIAAPEDDRS
jgi:hypothetical protein